VSSKGSEQKTLSYCTYDKSLFPRGQFKSFSDVLLISKIKLKCKDTCLENFFLSVGSEVLTVQLRRLPSSEISAL
jgi:hypothetical protein